MSEKMTGYPSIDKPWEKYYSEDAIHAEIPDISIYEQLCKNNKDNIHGKALSYFSVNYTYKELIEKIDKVAGAFQNIGVKKGDVVNVALPNIPENIFIVYGLNKIGAIANLIDLRAKGEMLIHYLNEANSKIVVLCDLFAENLLSIIDKTSIEKAIVVSPMESLPLFIKIFKKKRLSLPPMVMQWSRFVKVKKCSIQSLESKGDDVAVILHTSGTTGISKGVMLTNRNVNAMAIQYKVSGMHYIKGDLFLNQVPPFLAYNIVLATHVPLSLNMHLLLLPTYEPEKFASNISKYKPSHVVAGPADWSSFLNFGRLLKDYSFLKTLASGSDSMNIEIKQNVNILLAEKGCKFSITEGYGMTEVGSAACTNLPSHDVLGSVGIPLPLMNFCIWDNEKNEELKYGKQGEICISGPTLMKEYYNMQSETQDVIKMHSDGNVWLHTGDLGYVDNDGNIWLVGRLKRIIILFDGQKVSPFQIENVIRQCEYVKECCVVGGHDSLHENGRIPIAYVVLNNSADKSAALLSISELCDKELKAIYQPAKIEVIDALPLTPNGKVDYRKLEERALNSYADV